MASYTFDQIKVNVAIGAFDMSNVPDGAYKVALVTSAVFADEATGSLASETSWDDISQHDITNSASYNNEGYTGAVDITNVGILSGAVNGFVQVKISATDVVFPQSQIDADGAVIYKNDVNKTLYQAMDFGGKQSSNNGIFTIPMADNGFLRIL